MVFLFPAAKPVFQASFAPLQLDSLDISFVTKPRSAATHPMFVVQALIQDKSFRKWVELYAKDQDKFFDDFAAAYQKLLHLGVPVNNPGQHAPA